MPTPEPADLLQRFVRESGFAQRGAVITDLDGTAVHEHEGRIVIPKTVSHGLQQVYALARPIVINTLRFPLNVIRADLWPNKSCPPSKLTPAALKRRPKVCLRSCTRMNRKPWGRALRSSPHTVSRCAAAPRLTRLGVRRCPMA